MQKRAPSLFLLVFALAAPVAGAGAAPRVKVMVVGRSDVLLAPRAVDARQVIVRASGKRCAVGAATPLAALAGARRAGGPSFTVRDYGGSCSSRPADSASLFVTRVGGDRNRGRDGWAYKVGTRAGSAGAADLTGPFGRGRLRSGASVTWFWCRLGGRGSCQRTLSVSSRRGVRRGGRLRVRVRAYDDAGHAILVRGARVAFGSARARTDARGIAIVRAPGRPGSARLTATRAGMVRAFDHRIRVT